MNTEATLTAEPTTETLEEVKVTEPAAIEPAPAQEKVETEEDRIEKLHKSYQKRIDRQTRKFYETVAELTSRQTQEPQAKADGEIDVNEIVERKLAEREQQKHQETVEQKKESIFSKLEKSGGFDREDFIENVIVTPVMADAILDSDCGDKVVKHLYSNPEEAERIASLPFARQAVEIGKLEVKLSAAPAPVKKSAAPSPIQPISGSKVSDGFSDDMSTADWIRERNKQLHKR